MTKEDKKNEDDAPSAGATFGVLLGGILWWNDAVSLWGALSIALVTAILIDRITTKENEEYFENLDDITNRKELQKQKKEQNKIIFSILKWGLKWGVGISAFFTLAAILADDKKTPFGIILVSFVLFTALIGLSLALIRIVWIAAKEKIENRKKEKSIIEHFKNMPKPGRKIIAKPPQEDDDFNLPDYGVAVWKSSKGLPINFNYKNANGEYSERTVIIHQMTKDSKTRFYFHGYCLLRKAKRTFNSENIQDIYDMNGEILDLPDFINKLAGYDAYGTTEVKSVEKDEKNDTLRKF